MDRRAAFLAAVFFMVILSTAASATVDTHWTGASGDWFSPANWSDGVPTPISVYGADVYSSGWIPGETITISNGGTAVINGPGAQCDWLCLGSVAGQSGSIVMNSGDLTMFGAADFVGTGPGGNVMGGTGTFTLNSGTINTADGCQLEVGSNRGGCTGYFYQNGGLVQCLDPNWATAGVNADEACYIGAYGTGTYTLAAGTFNSAWTNIGYGGNPGWAGPAPGIGYFVQTGGIHAAALVTVGGGWDDGGTGTYTISSTGVLNVKELEVAVMDGGRGGAQSLVGTFNQNGGVVTVTSLLLVASNGANYGGTGGAGVGTYNFYGGTLADGGAGASMTIRDGAGARGTFQGHGVVNFTGTLTNNGRVIADGGTLDLSSFTAVTSTVQNIAANGSTNNGWFAINGGKIVLPPVVATVAAPAVNWGENSADATLTLVNSAKVTAHGLSGSASFAINLSDPVYSKFIGAWNVNVTPSGSLTNWDLALRYDDLAAGANEGSLKMFTYTSVQHHVIQPLNGGYVYTGSRWTTVSSTLNSTDNIISAAGLTSTGAVYFAVGTSIPGDTNLDNSLGTWDIDAIYQHFGAPYTSQWKVYPDTKPVGQEDVTYELQNIFHTNYGDATLGGYTDFSSFQVLLDHWQAPGGWAQGDFTGDGIVDFLDFQILLDYWNPGGWSAGTSQVPEPATMSLILLGGLAMLRRYRRA
jgi:hypothetical protein